jgi:polysaccharide deacetylase 2 family uncharacterized protein YibQ
MAKKRTYKKKSKSRNSYIPKIIIFILSIIIVALVTYILLSANFDNNITLEEQTPALNTIYKENIQTKKYKVNIEKEYKKIVEEKKKIYKHKVKIIKPKLAIIIDDVSFKAHVRRINEIGYPVTMAFLPPTSRHKNSAKIAQNIPFYMIHFPLEAKSFKFAEANTLKITDSYDKILARVKYLHKLYPNASFTNNHTGSKFTSNIEAMNKLMKALKQYNFTFVDSRTTAKSVAKQTAKQNGVRFLTRNIFLDNKQDKTYIQNQLIKAVNIAKKHGSAIAICHPRKLTLKTLKESKHLLKDVDLVLVNKL